MRECSDPFTRRVLRAVRRSGWRIKDTRHGWVLLAPDGEHRVTLHTSESRSGHTVTASRLKSLGVEVDL